MIVAKYGSLADFDTASTHRGWPEVVAVIALCAFVAAGVLSLSGLGLAFIAKGSPRLVGGLFSCLMMASFFANFVLAVNSFH